MSLSRASTPALAGLAVLAVALYAVAEQSVRPVHAEAYQRKLQAVRLMQRAERTLRGTKARLGIVVDPQNDPDSSGVIGPQYTLITTDQGAQSAKSLAAHPNFAAAVTQMMLQAGVGSGDLVAVGMTGSLPGMNLAVLAACRAIGAEPVVITSLGASTFGATDTNLTWLDMEAVLARSGLWPYRSLAASLGGGADLGRGLSPAGRELLRRAIARNGARFLDAANLFESVRQRVALYDSVSAARGKPLKLYVNVGGGLASLGSSQNGHLIPAGLSRRLSSRYFPNRGVINVLGERRIPVLHLLQVEKLARDFGIVDDATRVVAPGRGLLFVKYRYNLFVVALVAALLFAANLVVLRHDLRQQLLGQVQPERVKPT